MAPKIIKVKRGDVENLDNHLLADGEPAFSRNRTMSSGPQRGETIPDNYFRVGDGTNLGGIVPGASTIGVGLQYSIATAAAAMTKIEELVGSLWTPWVTKTFNAPYNPFRPTPINRDCLTPDTVGNIPNVHLGNGFLMFDGTGFEMKITNNPFRAECDYTSSTDVENVYGSTLFGLFDAQTGYTRDLKNFNWLTAWAVLDRTALESEVELFCFKGGVGNFADTTAGLNSATCFAAMAENAAFPGVDPPIYNRRINNWYGFKALTLENDKNESPGSAYIGNYFGFYIEDQTADAFDGNVYGAHIYGLDSGTGDGTTSGVTRGYNIYRIGQTATRVHAFGARLIGTDAVVGTVGATEARGLSIGTIGSVTDTISAYGSDIEKITGGDVVVGHVIRQITMAGNDATSYGAGFEVKSLQSETGSLTPLYGFVHNATDTTSDSVYSFAALNVSTSDATGRVYGVYLDTLGSATTRNVYGLYATGLGNTTSTVWAAGVELRNISAATGRTRGVQVSTISNDGTGATDNATAFAGWDITGSNDVYGVSIGFVRSGGTVIGFNCDDVYTSNVDSTDWVYGFRKEDQTDQTLKRFAAFSCGDVDCLAGNNGNIYGIKIGTLGATYASAVYGLSALSLGNSSSTISKGISITSIVSLSQSVGVDISSVTSSDVAIGVNVGTVTIDNASYNAIAYKCANLSNGDRDQWTYGFAQHALVTQNTFKHATFNSYLIDSSGEVQGVRIESLGTNDATAVMGMHCLGVGNTTTTEWSVGYSVYNVRSSGSGYGLYVNGIQGTTISGVAVENINGASGLTTAFYCDDITSSASQAVGFYCGDVFRSNPANEEWLYGFYKKGQTTKSIRKFAAFASGDISCLGGDSTSSLNGIMIGKIGLAGGEICKGIFLDSIYSTVSSTAFYANNVNSTVTATGIQLGNIRTDSTSTGTATGLVIGSVTSEGGTSYGIRVGNVSSNGNQNAYGIKVDTPYALGTGDAYALYLTSGLVHLPATLPTDSTGLSAGDLWNDGGTLKIVTA